MKRAFMVDTIGGTLAVVTILAALGRTLPMRLEALESQSVEHASMLADVEWPDVGRQLPRSPFRIHSAADTTKATRAGAPSLPPVPATVVAVRAIVGGPPWSALLAGVAGCAAACVVRPGDVLADVRVVRIDASRVVLAIADSTWSVVMPSRTSP